MPNCNIKSILDESGAWRNTCEVCQRTIFSREPLKKVTCRPHPHAARELRKGQVRQCVWETRKNDDGSWTLTCKACGAVRTTPVDDLYRECDRPLDCVHRGLAMGAVECEGCSGMVKLKVFACSVESIGKCTLKTPADGHGCCGNCSFRKAPGEES